MRLGLDVVQGPSLRASLGPWTTLTASWKQKSWARAGRGHYFAKLCARKWRVNSRTVPIIIFIIIVCCCNWGHLGPGRPAEVWETDVSPIVRCRCRVPAVVGLNPIATTFMNSFLGSPFFFFCNFIRFMWHVAWINKHEFGESHKFGMHQEGNMCSTYFAHIGSWKTPQKEGAHVSIFFY